MTLPDSKAIARPNLVLDLLLGASSPLRALLLLARTTRLWGYVLLPILLNCVIWAGLYVGLLLPGWRVIDQLVAGLPAWASLLGGLLQLLLVAGLLIITGVLLLQFGVILGSPWYGQLSEQLEQLRTGKPPVREPFSLGGAMQDIGRALQFELKKLLLALVVGGVLLLLNLLPGLGTILASIGGIVLAATLVCLDFFDAPLERRRLAFRSKLQLIYSSLPGSASFGLVCLALISVPFLNLLTIPLCVAGGTIFFCDRMAQRLASREAASRNRD